MKISTKNERRAGTGVGGYTNRGKMVKLEGKKW